ncbi:MAG: PilZ domain-containing protein [Methylomonas sp.]|nr:PilZ domain-containing protein [Methylomonas sp.]PPD22665.1 MAG: pilus assembly protein PilZ [Methylomonas sp.]PPD27981.1 MAG: pilus assembly protein PilZ [Methylomonas sp.]PPD40089.1 MAG: pilus assembly protein PilZ [Methylomonas sp.]PPD41080.1 MAG: pilus assembly protein PilZ [Methylomonas sp.]
MEVEKRSRKRFCPQGMLAHIVIEPPPPDAAIRLDGCVIDMSYGGIRIRLDEPFAHDFDQAGLMIAIRLPESGVEVFIRGSIKHVHDQHHCGVQYADCLSETDMDELMFECVKLSPQDTCHA